METTGLNEPRKRSSNGRNWQTTAMNIGVTVGTTALTAFIAGICSQASANTYRNMSRGDESKKVVDVIPLRKTV